MNLNHFNTTVSENIKSKLLLKVKTRENYRMEEMMKIAKEVKKIKIDKGDSLKQFIYIKYKEEENIEKPLLWMKAKEKIAEITTKEENGYDGESRGRIHL